MDTSPGADGPFVATDRIVTAINDEYNITLHLRELIGSDAFVRFDSFVLRCDNIDWAWIHEFIQTQKF